MSSPSHTDAVPSAAALPAPAPRRASRWLVELALCALLFGYYGFFVQVPGPNELSRYDLALALVRDGTTRIDAYEANTIDKGRIGGAHYTDKAIGTSLLAVPALALLDLFGYLGDYGDYRTEYPVHVATRLAAALPAALGAWSLYRIIRRLGRSAASGLLTAASLALGSAYAVFATHLYGHGPAAALGLLAAGVVFFRRAGWRGWLAAGLLAGLAVLVEYPAAIVAAALGALALAQTRSWAARAPIVAYAAGGALALLPIPLYGLASFGNPLAIGYSFVDDPAFAGARQGLFGVTLPTREALWEITLGPAGLVTQSPFFLLALPGTALWLWRSKRRAEGLASGGIILAFLFVNAGYYLPLGGQSLGPRFLVPALPFLALATAFAPRWLRLLGLPLLAYSSAAMLGIVAVYPKTGPGHPDAIRSYWWPRLLAGDVGPNWGEVRLGLHDLQSLLPLAGLAGLALAGLALGLLVSRLERGAASERALGPRLGRLAAAGYAGLALAAAAFVSAPVDFQAAARPPAAFAQRALAVPPPDQLRVRFGEELELVGYRVASDTVRPGEAVRLELFWRALRPIGTRYSTYVHLFGRGGEKLGGFDTVPGGGAYPAEMWPVGAVVRETYRVRVSPAAVAPAALQVRIGVYESGVLRELSAVDPRGEALGPGPALIRLRLGHPVAASAAGDAPRASFGDTLALVDWALPTAERRAGEMVEGVLRLRALRRPERDYTVFVQVLGPAGVVAQWDSQPLGGDYPTSLWPPGEVVEDRFRLALPPDLAPGEYGVIAGLYDLATMERLTAGAADFVRLGELRVGR